MAELTSQPASIQSLYSMYRERKLYVNRRYQRKLVWTLNEKQKLIESVLKKFPIPAVLLAEREGESGSYEIIDGLQRLQALLSFIEMSFQTEDGHFFNANGFPTALKYAKDGVFQIKEDAKQISIDEVSVILDYTITLSVMRGASEAEINDVFGRINTYGHRLSDQERRQAGVQNSFSEMVRTISCKIRGDVSANTLPLSSMQSISIDLPKTKHGYQISAEEVFWVKQGILRSTDLRDSMDEQCVADICASIIGGVCMERSKEALDKIYDTASKESDRMLNSLQIYGSEKLSSEFTFCIDQILQVCGSETLRTILFSARNTNGFPSVFAIVFIAMHELLIKDNLMVSNYSQIKQSLHDLNRRIETGQRGASSDERRRNIDAVKGLIQSNFVNNDKNPRTFLGETAPDIDVSIRRSEIELPNYELKQGILTLDNRREVDSGMIEKIVNTIAAIANNGPDSCGGIILGVADKDSDAERIRDIDGIEPKIVGNRKVVGICREAKVINKSIEDYVGLIKNGIRSSELSDAAKMSVLSAFCYNNYYGLGVVLINVPQQKEMAFVGDKVYWRNADSTELIKDPKKIANIARRF